MGIQVVTDPKVKITRPVIEAARKRRTKGVRIVVRDTTCPGLALVISPTGDAWRFEWRPRGTDPTTGSRWASQAVTIGTPESHPPDAARDEAGRLRGQAKTGVDLGAKRRAQIEEASKRRASTVAALLSTYKRELPQRPKLRGTGPMSAASAKAELDHVRLAVEAMEVGDRPASAVSPADLQRMLTKRARQPATARKHYGALSRFLDWAVEAGHIEFSPCAKLPKGRRPRAVASRPNTPSLADLAAIWIGADSLPSAERDALRWLIAVPCRLREATNLDWRHVRWDSVRVELPGSMMKNREPHAIPLHPVALDLLKCRHLDAGEPLTGLVFPAVRSGKAIDSLTKLKAAVVAASGVVGWTPHDFRRGFVSAVAERGVAEPVADALISHRQSATRGGVLGVYQRSTRWPEQVAAMNLWGAVLHAAITNRTEATADDGNRCVSF